jgi:hypothetical protein
MKNLNKKIGVALIAAALLAVFGGLGFGAIRRWRRGYFLKLSLYFSRRRSRFFKVAPLFFIEV